MMRETIFNEIFKNRRILITGHTGFKGSWLCLILNKLGAEVYGYALEPPTHPSLFNVAKIDELMTSYIGDIRDYSNLSKVVQEVQPEMIIHMAAQALVLESYKNPRETYEINVMGTVNILDIARLVKSVRAIVNVTTDKCYENKEWHWGYREIDPLGGYDPYSNSKGCSELVTSSYRNSFFNARKNNEHTLLVATARAGNVIGGGDWANNRLIPDFIRAVSNHEIVRIRSPYAIRPWQHVMEPLTGYLTLASKLFKEGEYYAQAWNFGPNDDDVKNVEWITRTICELWGEGANLCVETNPQPHEANYLKLDCSKSKAELNWAPKWDILTSLQSIVDWNKNYISGNDMRIVTEKQIESYFSN